MGNRERARRTQKRRKEADGGAQSAGDLKKLGGKLVRGFVNGITGGAADTLDRFQERQAQTPNPAVYDPLIAQQNDGANRRLGAALDDNTRLREGELPAAVAAGAEPANAALDRAADAAARAGSGAQPSPGQQSGRNGGAETAPETGIRLNTESGSKLDTTRAHTEAVRRVLESGGEFGEDTLDEVPGNGINAAWRGYFKKTGGRVGAETFLNANNIANALGMPLEEIIETLKDSEKGPALLKRARETWEAQPQETRNVWRTREDYGAAPPEEAPAEEPPGPAPSPAAAPPAKPAAPPPATVPGRSWIPDLNGKRAGGAYGNTTNTQMAAVMAGQNLYAWEKKREEYNAALGLKLDNTAFDLRSQGIQLAESVRNMSPEKQRMEIAKWRDKIMRNPAYSPLADGISPQEKAMRAQILNGVSRDAIGRIQTNSLEQQRSQAVADMESGSEAVIADIARGVYNGDPQQAYTDGMLKINAEKQYLNPQQYKAAVAGLYEGITAGLYGAAMGEFLSDAAGEPVYGIADVSAMLGRLAQTGAGYMGAPLGEDAARVFGAKADALADGAAVRVAAYNRGLLDTRNMEYNEALEAGNYSKAQDIAKEWREKRQNMIDAGAVTDEQRYQTRKYFGAGETAPGAGGRAGAVKSGAASSIAKSVLPELQSWSATGQGLSPADALEKVARAIREQVAGPDGQPLSEEAARTTALLELSSQWAKSADFKYADAVPNILADIVGGVKDFAKTSPGSDTASMMKFAQDTFFESLFSLSPDASHKEFTDRMAEFGADFINNAVQVFDGYGDFDEKTAKGVTLPVKDVEKELETVSGFAKKYGADPNKVFGVNGLANDRFAALEGTLKKFVSDIYPSVPPEGVSIQFDTETGDVYASVNGPGPGYGNLSHLFKVDFANGISGFHDRDIAFTDRATGVKYRVNRHGKVETFNIRAENPAPEQIERIRREESRQ